MRQCLVCEKELEIEPKCEIKFGRTIGIIYDATIWRSHGNYGSTKYDPMGESGKEEFLETYLCDSCLEKKSHLIYHVEFETKVEENVKAQSFKERQEQKNVSS